MTLRSAAMTGTIALQGGGPFTRQRRPRPPAAARRVGADRVVVLPTADAFEQPAALIAAAMSWGERLDVEVEALMVLQRHDAEDDGRGRRRARRRGPSTWSATRRCTCAARSRTRRCSPRSASVLAAGGLVAAVGESAAALCDPMLDQRGGAFTLGLGLVRGVVDRPRGRVVERGAAQAHAVAGRHAGRRAADRARRCVRGAGGWELVGDADGARRAAVTAGGSCSLVRTR